MTNNDKNKSANGKQHRRYSLTKIINSGLFVIVSLVVVLALSTYYRLSEFNETLNDVSEKSLTTVISSGEIFIQVNNLARVSERLVNANSDPHRRISYGQINDQLAILTGIAERQKENAYMLLQLYTISKELSDLNQLVIRKLTIHDKMLEKQTVMYGLYQKLMDTETANGDKWQQHVSEIVTRTGEILIIDRLNVVREKRQAMSAIFDSLEDDFQSGRESVSPETINLIGQLNTTVTDDIEGIFSLRQEQLKVIGRARGRANMVNNLILDYARLAEFESYQLNSRILEDARNASGTINNQIQNINLVFLFIVLVIIGFSVFVHRLVVTRILRLRNQIQQRLEGVEQDIALFGNDEISDLAETFDSFAKTIENQKQTLSEMSLIDALTGVANRRALDERFEQEVSIAIRRQWPISMLLLDIDFFKQYNDNYGHGKGDDCLRQVAQVLMGCLPRKTDFLARYGGEEFAIILPDTDMKGAIKVAENIIDSMARANIAHEYSRAADFVTMSVGIAFTPSITLDDAELLIEQADKALYKAKRKGRNRFDYFDISSVEMDSAVVVDLKPKG